MTKDEFKKNEHWALRKKRVRAAERVKLLLLVSRGGKTQVKVRHVGGELECLEEFVWGHHLICRWTDWPRIVRDERLEAELAAQLKEEPMVDEVAYDAAGYVLEASGETSGYMTYGKNLYAYAKLAELERIANRAGVSDRPWNRKPCFTRRDGQMVVPCQMLLELAIAFAAAEPEVVDLYLDKFESEGLAEAMKPGREYMTTVFIRSKPAYAIARQWAGTGSERDFLRREIQRLRGVALEAAALLRAANPTEAQRIECAVLGQPERPPIRRAQPEQTPPIQTQANPRRFGRW